MGATTGWAYEGDLRREARRRGKSMRRPARSAALRHLAPALFVIMLAAFVLGSFAAFAVASPAVPGFDKYEGLSGQTPDSMTAERGAHPSPAVRQLLGERFAAMKATPGMSSAFAALGTGSISGKVTNASGVGIPAIVVVTDITEGTRSPTSAPPLLTGRI